MLTLRSHQLFNHRISSAIRSAGIVFAGVLLAGGAWSQTVPAEFQAAYTETSNTVSSFDQNVTMQWNGLRSPVAFGGELSFANSARGSGLLNTYGTQSILLQMNQLQAMGMNAVTLNLSYPALLPEFYGSTDEYNRYVKFYSDFANTVRSMGMKLIVRSTAMLSSGEGSTRYTIANFYKTVATFDQYKTGRATVAQTIAMKMRPDYLVVMMEPDVEQGQTGQPVNTADNAAALVSTVSMAVKSVSPLTRVGAGTGTWSPMYSTLAGRFASMTTIDFLDMHIYPAANGFLDRAGQIADIAASYGKKAAISETWIYKVTTPELIASQANPASFFQWASRRDYFTDMAPLDAQYLQAIVKFAYWKNLEFLSPIYSQFYFTYLNYSQYRLASNATLSTTESLSSYTAMQNHQLTPAGTAFSAAIR